MINYTEQLMYGLMPVQRDDPQAGQSAYYYFDPRYGDDDARHIVDVPYETSPNPNAGAIQQYLYENDEYRYKNLYGDTPPPTRTAVNDYTVNTENLMGKPSSYFQDNNSADWSGNIAGIGVNPSYDTTPVLKNQTPTPWSNNNSASIPRIWENAADGKRVYDYVLQQEGNFIPPNQNLFEYISSAVYGGMDLLDNFSKIRKMNATDKYKHALMNCYAAQYGQGGADVSTLASNLREWYDKQTGANTLDSSNGDQYANKIGRLLGGKYPEDDCDELVQKYIDKHW